MKEYHVGDMVWVAECAPYSENRVPCPVCFGKKEVTLILGNGDSVILPCEYCQKGYESPTGYVIEHEPIVRASLQKIDRVEITETQNGQVREYATHLVISGGGSSSCHLLDNENIFDTEGEALAKAETNADKILLSRRREKEAIKVNCNKSFAWHAGYHMREAKRLREQIKYHENQAVLCKAKSKGKEATQ